jgi:hypothetical protein
MVDREREDRAEAEPGEFVVTNCFCSATRWTRRRGSELEHKIARHGQLVLSGTRRTDCSVGRLCGEIAPHFGPEIDPADKRHD